MITSPQTAGFRSGIVRAANQQRRDSAILIYRSQGRTVQQIADRLKITPRAVYMSLRRAGHDAQTLIAEEIKREAVSAEMILTRLSEMFNADYGEIIEPQFIHDDKLHDERYIIDGRCQCPRNPRAGSYLPLEDWPPIWRRMLAGVDVEELNKRSSDGEDGEKRGGWDVVGQVVKLKFVDPLKLIELAMKHKDVDAMVNSGDKLAGAVGDLAGSIDRAIAEGRQRASQRNRLPINVTPVDNSSE